MSLTEAEHVFAGIHEDGLNDLLRAFFAARGHYLRYGSPAFVATTTASETTMSPILFPGVPGGIDWAVAFSTPRIDLFRQTDPALPPELSIGANQFSLRTAATLCIACDERERPQDDPFGTHGQGGPKVHPACTELTVWATGHLNVRNFGGGSGDIGFAIDAVEIVDIAPNSLESMLECLILMILRGALAGVRLPFTALRAGAFDLLLTRGPEINDDRLKLYGTT